MYAKGCEAETSLMYQCRRCQARTSMLAERLLIEPTDCSLLFRLRRKPGISLSELKACANA